MSEWQEYKFSDLLVDQSISYGIVQPGFHIEIDSVPIIRVNNIKNGKIKTDDVLKVSSEIERKFLKTRLEGGELLITVVGSIGECAIVPISLKGWNVARAVSVARIDEAFDKRFIKYCFKSEELIFQMYGNTNDTVQPTLNLSSLKELILSLPSLPEQKDIASVLSSLDDKIDLLHRQNTTLESMAETLFRHWFVEEALDSNIAQFIELQSGYAFKSNDFKDNGIHRVLKIKNISGGIIDVKNTDFLDTTVPNKTDEKFKVMAGDVLFAMTGAEIGKLGIVPKTNEPLWLNQRVGLLKEKYQGARFLAYLQLNSDFGQDYIENSATGSAQPNISGGLIEQCPFPKVGANQLKECAEILNVYYQKLISNLGQIQTIEQLRDTLLPKLMSGEIRINYA